MIERTVVFVDTSYLLASFYNSWETGARGQLQIDLPHVVSVIDELARAQVAQPVQRQFWYDGIPDSGPHRYQRSLRTVPGVQLRAGQLIEWGDRRTQKAVDTRLVADMVLAAVRGTCSDMFLVTGDADMIPGVEEAVANGVRVHLIGFGWDSMSAALRQACDTVTILDPREDFSECMRLEILEGPIPPVVKGNGDAAECADAGVDISSASGPSSGSGICPNATADPAAGDASVTATVGNGDRDPAPRPRPATPPPGTFTGPVTRIPQSHVPGRHPAAPGQTAPTPPPPGPAPSAAVPGTPEAVAPAGIADGPDDVGTPGTPDGPDPADPPARPDPAGTPHPGDAPHPGDSPDTTGDGAPATPARPVPSPSMMAPRRKPRSRYVPLPDEVWTSSREQTPFDVGRQYATWWFGNAASERQRDEAHLLCGGGLPPEIDRPLLQFACQMLHEYTLTQTQRVGLRDGFHDGIRALLLR